MRRAKALLALIALALLTTSSFAVLAAPGPQGCDGFADRPMLGPSCPVQGGYKVFLPDGTTVLTHGPDAAPSLMEPLHVEPRLIGFFNYPVKVPPLCVEAGQPRGVIIYAHAPGQDRYATFLPEIRRMFEDVSNRLFYRGLELGMPTRYKMACDDPTTVSVKNVAVNGGPSFWSVAGAVASAGYNKPTEKYWVWYDGCFCGGVGSLWYDDRGNGDNYNNGGPSWGVTYGHGGEFGALVMMHENGHNLGAVQNSSPNASGGFHCNDGQDIMCYPDGGPTSNYNGGVCPNHPTYGPRGANWDCGANDYFNPNPPAGSYLASHWNLGAGYARFLQHGLV